MTDQDFNIVECFNSHLTVVAIAANEISRQGIGAMLGSLSSVMKYEVLVPPSDGTMLAIADDIDILLVSCNGLNTDFSVRIAADARSREAKVLVLFDGSREELFGDAIKIPSDGYLAQGELTAESLEKAFSGIIGGDVPMSGRLAGRLLENARHEVPPQAGRNVYLTPRERQTLELLAEGMSNKQIARRMGISQHGVKRLVANLLAKLNCPNRTLVVAVALRDGLLSA